MTLALLCQFTAQHVSDVNTSIFRSLRLLVELLCRLYCGKCTLQNIISLLYYKFCDWHGRNEKKTYSTAKIWYFVACIFHNTAYTITQQISRKLLKMDVLTSETCWAVNWHNKASVIKVGLPLFKYQDDARSNTHKILLLVHSRRQSCPCTHHEGVSGKKRCSSTDC